MDNVLFTVDIDNTVAVWAPLNSWEPHILYQRASLDMGSSLELVTKLPSQPTISTFCIVVDSTELTKALETVCNRTSNNMEVSKNLEIVADIARKSPELCLVVNHQGDNLCVWGVDVIFPETVAAKANQESK